MANGNFGGGDGTPSNPYLVEDAFDINEIRNRHYSLAYKQTQDIDMSIIHNFAPLFGNDVFFEGVYDGNNKKIKNLRIVGHELRREENRFAGLFGKVVRASLTNILFENVYISNAQYAGALCGSVGDETVRDFRRVSTRIRNCHVLSGNIVGFYHNEAGKVEGGDRIGGLIGFMTSFHKDIAIYKCSVSNTTIHGSSEVGGFVGGFDVGYSSNVRISNCFANVKMVQPNEDGFIGIGGFVGYVHHHMASFEDQTLEMINCYASVSRIGTFYDSDNEMYDYEPAHYAFIGQEKALGADVLKNSHFKIESLYYDAERGDWYDYLAEPKSTVEMKQKETFVGWDFTTVWKIEENVKFPFFIGVPTTVKCQSFKLIDF